MEEYVFHGLVFLMPLLHSLTRGLLLINLKDLLIIISYFVIKLLTLVSLLSSSKNP